MHTITPPKLTATFKPRAEAGLLSQLIQDAWTAKNAALKAACEAAGVTDKITTLLVRLYPANDMAVLRKYSQAREAKSVSLRIYNPDTKMWDYTTGVDLPAPVMVPDGFVQLYVGGPRHSEDPNFGIKPSYRTTLTAEKWQEIVDYHTKADARRLPKDTEAFFADLMAAQNTYRAEYKQAVDWPQEYKAEHGNWPTWGDIANKFPVLGEYIRSLVAVPVAELREAA